jgi:hypothetical protein
VVSSGQNLHSKAATKITTTKIAATEVATAVA